MAREGKDGDKMQKREASKSHSGGRVTVHFFLLLQVPSLAAVILAFRVGDLRGEGSEGKSRGLLAIIFKRKSSSSPSLPSPRIAPSHIRSFRKIRQPKLCRQMTAGVW